MNFSLILRMLLVCINSIGLMLGWWVISSKNSRNIKKWFTAMDLCMLLWVNFAYFGINTGFDLLAVLLLKLNYGFVSLFLPSFYYFYVIHFLKKGRTARRLGNAIFMLALILFVISVASNLVIYGVTPQNWGNEIVFGSLALFYNLFAAFVAIIVIYYSLKDYNQLSKSKKDKRQYFLIGILIFIAANLIFNVGFQIVFKSVHYAILADFSSVFLLGFTAYSIIQHELFDVKVVTTQALTIFIWVVLLARTIVSTTSTEIIINLAIFMIMLVFGILLIQSINKEIDQRKRLEELTRKLKELDERKDEFLSIVAHELRAPLTAVKGYVSMILDGDAGEVGDKTRDFLFDVNSSNDRMIRLVGNMLDMSRIEENRIVYQISDIHLREILNDVHREFSFEANRLEIELQLEIPDNLQDLVRVDKDRLHEVLSNFTSNALKYTEEGSVTIRTLNPDGGQTVRVEVVDTGRGIPADEQKELFQKFYRAESEKTKSAGTGLGLYVSKLLIESFKGKVGVISNEGQGSTFWFELPLLPSK